MVPDLTSLSLFLRVVRTGSISRGAEESHIVLSAASRRITQLEAHFGCRLLHRARTGVVPSLAGEMLAVQAKQVLSAIAQLNAEMRDFVSDGLDRVRLYANYSVLQQSLPEVLAAFADAHPSIGVDVREAPSSSIVRALREGMAEIGIVTSGSLIEGLQCSMLCPDPLCVVVPFDHELVGPSVTFNQLLKFNFVGLDGGAALTQLLVNAAENANTVLRMSAQVRSFESVCRMVQAGRGIAVMPEGAVRFFLQSMSIRILRLSESWALRTMLVCTPLGKLSSQTRALVAHLLGRAA